MVEVRSVDSRRDLSAFLRVPWRVYDGDATWVPPLLAERRRHVGRANPFVRRAQVMLFVAWRDGAAVGRVSAQLDPMAQPSDAPAVGHFGLLEATDREAMGALLRAAEDALRRAGAARVEGPYSLSINDESGLLVDGFDRPPRLLMNYAPPWYGEALAELGYAKATDLLAYRFTVSRPLPRRALRVAEETAGLPDVAERPLDPRRLRRDMRAVIEIFNDAWAGNRGFVPMTDADLEYLTKSLKPALDARLVRLVEVGGEPAAMIVALPDLNQAIRDLDGRLLPFGWARLLWRLRRRPPRDGRVLLMGVRRRYHGTPLSAGLAALSIARLHAAAQAAGMREIELSWVLEDNRPTIRLIDLVGAEFDKRYRLYSKDLA